MEALHTKSYGSQQKRFRRKLIVTKAYIKKKERSQINNLSFHLKRLEKEYIKLKVIYKERKKVKQTKKTIERIDETKSWGFFGKDKQKETNFS